MNPENAIETGIPDPRLRLQSSLSHIQEVLRDKTEDDPNVVAYAEIRGERHVRIVLARPESALDYSTGHGGVLVRDISERI